MNRAEFEALCDQSFAIISESFDSPAARAMLWAVGRQEGRMEHRRQIGGPARGLWQFERGGGVKGVLTHKASKFHAIALCKARDIEPTALAVYAALADDDILACGFARLLLYTDPASLPPPRPALAQTAWAYYKRNWRPGKPHRQTWDKFWKEACHGEEAASGP